MDQQDNDKKKAFLNNINNKEFQESVTSMNKSLLLDIKLSLAIYKEKNNFEHKYINHKIDDAVNK